MPVLPDKIYYEERERSEMAMAIAATSRKARDLHEELAAWYRGLALAAEFNAQPVRFSEDAQLGPVTG